MNVCGTRDVRVEADMSPEASDTYVRNHPSGCGYHRPAWMGVIERAFGHQTRYLVARSGDRVAGVLPLVLFSNRLFGRCAVSMPFLNYGGILADDADVERALLNEAIEVTRKAGATHLELRHTRQHFGDLAPKRHKVAMLLRLESSPDGQWQALDRKLRNQVRKAEKSGLDAQDGGLELLGVFYQVFARNMRDLGTPVYSERFFREVLSTFPGNTRVFTVRLGAQPVAASIVHWHRDVIEVPWASSIRDFNPLCANVFLYWQMLRFAIDRGFQRFDFGRSTPGEGTFHFKKQWGAEAQELVWEYWMTDGAPMPNVSTSNPKFALAIQAWQRLPLSVANALGPFVVRNIP